MAEGETQVVPVQTRKGLSGRAKVALFVGAFCALVLFSLCGFLWLQWPTARLVQKLESQPGVRGKVVMRSWLPWGEEEYHSPTTWFQRFTGRLTEVMTMGVLDRQTIQEIAHRRGMEKLELWETSGVTEADLVPLGELRALQTLRLPGTVAVGDEAMAWVSGLSELRELQLWHASGVTGEGFRKLALLPKLETLRLARLAHANLAGIELANREAHVAELWFIEYRIKASVFGTTTFSFSSRDQTKPAGDAELVFAVIPRNRKYEKNFLMASQWATRGDAASPYIYQVELPPRGVNRVRELDFVLQLSTDRKNEP